MRQLQGAASTGPERTSRVREDRQRSGNAANGHSWTGSYRNFNVLRLSNAKMIAMIQKRTTTFGSSHPFSSK